MKKTTLHLIFITVFAIFSGCSKQEVNDLQSYLKWLDNPENAIKQTKHINGFTVSVKYLPAEYLAYKELKDSKTYNTSVKDSLVKFYQASRTFLFTIGPDESKNNNADIMMTGLRNYNEYKERSLTMNFDMENYIRLKTREREYKPVLSSLENIYGLKNTRSILFVFAPQEQKGELAHAGSLDFVYTDELFGLGIMHFTFTQEELEKIPTITFWQTLKS